MIGGCLICTVQTGDYDGWVDAELPVNVTMRSSFLGDLPPIPAGVVRLCPACAAWQPHARTAPPPLTLATRIGAITAGLPDTAMRRRAHAETLGWMRHLAQVVVLTPSERT